MESHHCHPGCCNAFYTVFSERVPKAFCTKPEYLWLQWCQMVALYSEEPGLGHNENKSADESAFFGQFANCVKAMDFFFFKCSAS